jgi:hypothetical protein
MVCPSPLGNIPQTEAFLQPRPLIRCDIPAHIPISESLCLFLPALSLQCHEILHRTFARRLARTHTRMSAFFQFRAPSSSASFDLASSPNESSTSLDYRSYAFVEFRSTRDAEDAYYDMYVL